MTSIEFKISFKWWIRPYIWSLGLFYTLSKRTPNFQKIGRVIKKGTIIELIKN